MNEMSEPKWKTWWEEHADPEYFLRVQRPRTVSVRPIIYALMENVLKEGDRVLDVACGSAVDYEPIRDRGFLWTGVDMTKKFVNYVHDAYKDAEMYQMDVSQGLKFRNQQFNLSYAKDLFEHLAPKQWKRVVSEMWRVSSNYMIIAFFKPPDGYPTDYHIVTEKENKETVGVYSNHYNKEEWIKFIQSLPNVHTISIKESIVYRRRWNRPKGYSVWLVKRHREDEKKIDALE